MYVYMGGIQYSRFISDKHSVCVLVCIFWLGWNQALTLTQALYLPRHVLPSLHTVSIQYDSSIVNTRVAHVSHTASTACTWPTHHTRTRSLALTTGDTGDNGSHMFQPCFTVNTHTDKHTPRHTHTHTHLQGVRTLSPPTGLQLSSLLCSSHPPFRLSFLHDCVLLDGCTPDVALVS